MVPVTVIPTVILPLLLHCGAISFGVVPTTLPAMPDKFDDDDEEDCVEHIRPDDEVARRCIALYAVIAAGHSEPREDLVAWLRREDIWDAVSPEESVFLLSDSPTQQEQINATWRAEALFPLLWSLGLLEELPHPSQQADLQLIRRVLPELLGSVAVFVSSARLRPDEEIHRANEDIYQIHWKVRDAQLFGRPVPDGFDSGVVQERHHALNWLIGYGGQEWDYITTDT
jgi:hypothetical protein